MKKGGFGYLSLVVFTAFLLVGTAFPLCARGTPEVPTIPPVTSGTQYISPDGDGVQDEASISFEATLYVKSKEGYVPEYGLEIRSPSGEVVKRVVEKEERDIGWFASLFTGYKEFTLERSIKWDGMDESGEPVDDGVYNLSIWVADASDKKQEQQLDEFVVDTKAPSALIVEPDSLLFSPDGDGHKDTLSISHTQASEEDTWSGEFRDDGGGEDDGGEAVRTYQWEGTPGDIEWDGRDDEGAVVPDGTYTYVLESTDRAGNYSGEITLEGIEVDTTRTPIEVLIEPAEFSPNDSGIHDTATVYLDQAVKEGIVGWSWSVSDIHNNVHESHRMEGAPPEEMVLDGTTKAGEVYPQSRYMFKYSVEYDHGSRPTAEAPFRIDVTPPDIRVNVENPIFSPDGDGRKEQVRITYTSDEEVSWKGSITDDDGDEVYSVDSSRTTSLIVWDGRDEGGSRVEDGLYYVSGTFIDTAGNTVKSGPLGLKVDTEPVTVEVTAQEEAFSPNDDGVMDTMPFTIESNQHGDVQRWKLELLGSSGETRRVFSGSETLPESIVWDGDLLQADVGGSKPASEGDYTGRLTVEYKKGKTAEATTGPFVLDVTPPDVDMKLTKDPFARTNGEVEGEVFLGFDIEERNRVSGWTVNILDKEGDVLRTYSGDSDPSDDISWNSPSEENRKKFGDEEFTLEMEVSDGAGNTRTFTRKVNLDIFLVKKDGKYHIAVPNIIFGAYEHDLDSRGTEFEKRNLDSISRVADIYDRYPSYRLLLEGHALNIYRTASETEEREEREEEKILLPLTERRAATVKEALVEEGMNGGNIETEAFGGKMPIAPVDDLDERWKNRRVEFIMRR